MSAACTHLGGQVPGMLAKGVGMVLATNRALVLTANYPRPGVARALQKERQATANGNAMLLVAASASIAAWTDLK